ncbi:hypothetical protein PanWU01x14_076630 [Parasponia andersonii]|uniref:Uncharacterized protein n=1 Tax=Parasponia andersonii TaxID=3476 RepID=A0A2P5DCD1_PARAD|nr:hypothetical protein PanWU01x14_076630 [Parasponia andersonii]
MAIMCPISRHSSPNPLSPNLHFPLPFLRLRNLQDSTPNPVPSAEERPYISET